MLSKALQGISPLPPSTDIVTSILQETDLSSISLLGTNKKIHWLKSISFPRKKEKGKKGCKHLQTWQYQDLTGQLFPPGNQEADKLKKGHPMLFYPIMGQEISRIYLGR